MNPPEAADASDTGVQAAHVDADLLVLHKPPGLLCVPGRGPDKQDCLSARAQQRWPGALIVHRLDQATSGLVLMARHPDAQRRLSHAFAERQVHKRYQAVVQGRLGDDESAWHEINLPIAADWARRPLRVIDHALGKPSLTRWRALAHDAGAQTTRIELEPVTGRTHQLRVHLAAIGYPIVGDALYADAATQEQAPRLLLHASHLAFTHPATGALLTLEWTADF
ncbi:RNA pseudouridine synthase [Acidovorax carolinensis]|uniref:RNA pseudouridine synthase n=1 Tax=Acidovorax carolinensis TaxID=553814 RepID=A0A240UCM5_9BURK|nr:RluA family pseudouridine synthase [Acidovorax carolinensis]ART59238.1 RNA pseudouridine synthase [Acidovorax carolinensis]